MTTKTYAVSQPKNTMQNGIIYIMYSVCSFVFIYKVVYGNTNSQIGHGSYLDLRKVYFTVHEMFYFSSQNCFL